MFNDCKDPEQDQVGSMTWDEFRDYGNFPLDLLHIDVCSPLIDQGAPFTFACRQGGEVYFNTDDIWRMNPKELKGNQQSLMAIDPTARSRAVFSLHAAPIDDKGNYSIHRLNTSCTSVYSGITDRSSEELIFDGEEQGIIVKHDITFLDTQEKPVKIQIMMQNAPGQRKLVKTLQLSYTDELNVVQTPLPVDLNKLVVDPFTRVCTPDFSCIVEGTEEAPVLDEPTILVSQKIDNRSMVSVYGEGGDQLELLINGNIRIRLQLHIPILDWGNFPPLSDVFAQVSDIGMYQFFPNCVIFEESPCVYTEQPDDPFHQMENTFSRPITLHQN